MKFGFDLDGVLYPWHVLAWQSYRDDFDSNMTFEEFWRSPDGFVARNDGKENKDNMIIRNIVKDLTLYSKEDASKLFVDAVTRISNLCEDIYYITARPVEIRHFTHKWLRNNGFPKVENLYFADANGGKPALVERFDLDFFVEDRSKYIEALSNLCKVFIVNTPYNINDNLEGVRVDDIVDVANIMETGNICKEGWVL